MSLPEKNKFSKWLVSSLSVVALSVLLFTQIGLAAGNGLLTLNDQVIECAKQSQTNTVAKSTSHLALGQLESHMYDLINADRKNFGLSAVRTNSVLESLAQNYAEDMQRRHFRSHINPEGKSCRDRALERGIIVPVSENIAWAFDSRLTADQLIRNCEANLMSEAPNDPFNHRGNILNPNHICVGIGIAIDPDNGEVITVQEFADTSP